MQSACQISAYAHYARTPVLQLKQRTDDFVVFCVFAAMGVTSTKSGRLEVNLSLSEKRGGNEEPFGNNSTFSCFRIWRFCMVMRSLLPISLETMHDPKEPVLLIALKIMRHAKLYLSVIMFLICVCWHPERMCRALSTCGQRGQV